MIHTQTWQQSGWIAEIAVQLMIPDKHFLSSGSLPEI